MDVTGLIYDPEMGRQEDQDQNRRCDEGSSCRRGCSPESRNSGWKRQRNSLFPDGQEGAGPDGEDTVVLSSASLASDLRSPALSVHELVWFYVSMFVIICYCSNRKQLYLGKEDKLNLNLSHS